LPAVRQEADAGTADQESNAEKEKMIY